MLSLLIKTRLKYYRNYIRYHFDRRTKIEIGFIIFVLIALTLRSPADVGYNFKWIHSEKFPHHWANIFSIFIPIYYVIAEALAFHTLRTSKEWQLLVALPFSRTSVANYFWVRHLSKTTTLILISCLPFYLALTCSLDIRIFRFLFALGLLLILQSLAFIRASIVRTHYKIRRQGVMKWFLVEVVIIGIIFLMASWFRFTFNVPDHKNLLGLIIIWIIFTFFWLYIQKEFKIKDVEDRALLRSNTKMKTSNFSLVTFMSEFHAALIVNDILFLWRQKRTTFFIPLVAMLISAILCITADTSNVTFISVILIEIFFSFLVINTALYIFEKDLTLMALVRSLPVKSTSLWWARWLLFIGFIGLPMLIPLFISLVRFGVNLSFILFAIISIMIIPALVATLFCSSCFGLFPQINLSGFIIGSSIILMFLLWFFMPFGTLILFVVMLFWIRKSQRHFHYLEL